MAELTGFRDRVRAISPPFLQDGVGERLMYTFGLMLDYLAERKLQGVLMRNPTRCDPSAYATLCSDRLIERGFSESDESIAGRLQRAFDTWRLAGGARAVLSNLRPLFLPKTPRVRQVSTRFSGNPADLLFVSGATNANPIVITTSKPHGLRNGDEVTIERVTGNTNANQVDARVTVVDHRRFTINFAGNGAYSGNGYVIGPRYSATYPAPQLSTRWDTYDETRDINAEPEHRYVGAGGNFDFDSESVVLGTFQWTTEYIIIESVAPNDWCHAGRKWGDGWKYGDGTSWGLDVSADFGRTFRRVLGAFKGAQMYCRYIIITFDAGLFDPDGPSAPDGTWGDCTTISGGRYVRTRPDTCRFISGPMETRTVSSLPM